LVSLFERLDRRAGDVLRRGEVGLAGAEADDVDASGAQLPGFLHHGQCRGVVQVAGNC
jgi:hypothetical protein